MKKRILTLSFCLLAFNVLLFNAHLVIKTFDKSFDLRLSEIVALATPENEWEGWVKGQEMGVKWEWTGIDISFGYPPSGSIGLGFTLRSCCVDSNESTACNKNNEESQCKNI